jgi:hypothetical protein
MDVHGCAPQDPELAVFAEALGVDPATALRALGGGWRPVDDSDRVRPVEGWAFAAWFVTGQPVQVLIGVGAGSLVLARPVIQWNGVMPVLTGVEPQPFAREDLEFQLDLVADALEEIARRTRRRFRWCLTCHHPHPPELFQERGECMACGARYRGIVF